MAESALVLVTGSAGCIGRAAIRALKARGFRVRGLDLVPTPGVDEAVVGTITDGETVRRAAREVGTVIHLAATPDDDDFLTKLLPNNIVGVYHVLEAAREAGVRRVVLASSGQVVWWQRFRGPLPIRTDVPPTPRGWYAATKLFQEAAGCAFAEAHGLSVIAVRLGWCPRSREHVEELARADCWLAVLYSGGFLLPVNEASLPCNGFLLPTRRFGSWRWPPLRSWLRLRGPTYRQPGNCLREPNCPIRW